eukprot:CAMPEP_0174292854 /NCGR_PEP_ID=MMETSP0809-20121228/36685_1 /TAXON_ID=73025 ORGANISM="Eutreptiella gymnastica-like, Strain CCMP1594" /NCGR_SAMPLE_ID=MMETSP0809 /ASSEMBLY_ACC=CAM_ASM_000658 /LENGTH=304 /DNA_ID=CAMNT_0015393187 /DNA_START=62 /DNA_END=973 /DNA_ORIENTATION=-
MIAGTSTDPALQAPLGTLVDIMANTQEQGGQAEVWGYTNSYYLISGGLAGMMEHGIMFPVDTLKTRMQATAGSRIGIESAFKATLSHGGPLALYRGVFPGMLGAFPSHAAYFAVYEHVKRLIGINQEEETLLQYAVAGACATVGHDLFHTPFDVLKQRLQMSDYNPGSVNALRGLLGREGIRALFVSVPTTVAMNIPFAAVHFSTYETIKKILRVSEEELESSFWKYTIAGGIGGTLGGLISNPFDVIKTRQQLGLAPPNVFKAFADGYRQEGAALFAKGMRARLLYFAPSAAIAMTSYEVVKW